MLAIKNSDPILKEKYRHHRIIEKTAKTTFGFDN
jgi:hypothetical protein